MHASPPTDTAPQGLLDGLNPEQRAAVTAAGSALVLAGAGSGKTRVLTTRIAWLIASGQVSPWGVVAVTFTNKAAREMLARLSALLPIDTRGMWVGTFHGLCHRLLRLHHREAGLPQSFQILDAQDQLAAIKRLLKALDVDSERFEPRRVQAFVNAHKEAGLRAPAVEAPDPYSQRLVELYAEYDAQCQREGVVDFAELLLRAYELLSRNALLREHYQSRFRHILVDEFQDTSRLQYRWLRLLMGPETALFAVGDDDQSIYAFRGAHVGNMAQFLQDLGLAEPIRLTQNYRSQSNILEAANAVIRHNRQRLGKDLWTTAGAGEPIRHYEAQDDADEARFVVELVQALHEDGRDYRDIAVLYRANAQSRAIEHALFTAGLPYRVYGGLRFFERAEIKHALAYLRLTVNPEDDAAFLRVVNFPARGVGARTLEAIDAAARARGMSLWQAACAMGGKNKGLATFVALVEDLRRATAELPLAEAVQTVVGGSGLIEHYQSERDGAERIDNLRELANAAAAFSVEADSQDLAAFLAHAALEAGEHAAAAHADAVQLMTVHAAKGLEFHTVIITGLEEGLFPHENALATEGGLEEERRLMYVAITRARHRLYLTHARTRMLHGQPRYGLPSRFLDEIPPGLIQSLGRTAAHSTPVAAPTRTQAYPYPIGCRVQHTRYGEGVVMGYQGQGAQAEVRVSFPRVGEKWFILAYAKLSPC
ncbi:MAG: 3'-5' exonuclease [Burkholderiales bacterium]|nr:3'-5' exonuclease [Burkholderiales bacterium]